MGIMAIGRWSGRGIWTVAIILSATPAWPAEPPVPVAPGSATRIAVVPGRCPTFHWGQGEQAEAYELVIYRITQAGDQTAREDVQRVHLPRTVQGWTPSLEGCLETGGEYAWMLRSMTEGGEVGEWSAPLLFRVAAAPGAEEVEAALLVLERFMTAQGERERPTGEQHAPSRAEIPARPGLEAPGAHASSGGPDKRLPNDVDSMAFSPVLGSPSLKLDQQLHLGSASHTFKDGELYQWSDLGGNNALGSSALKSITTGVFNNAIGRSALSLNTEGYSNTAIGDFALSQNTTGYRNTAVGDDVLASNTTGYGNTGVGENALISNTAGGSNTAVGWYAGSTLQTASRITAVGSQALASTTAGSNTAVGWSALRMNTSGYGNTGLGWGALYSNVSGLYNTVVGHQALQNSTTGSNNIALGNHAGFSTNGSNNILILNPGVGGESNALRIGRGTGTGYQQLDKTFIHGIHGRTVAGGIGVLIKSDGQLGTSTSSRRFKEEIQDMGESSADLLELRPVTFRYTEEAVGPGEPRPLEFGLIAEEVAEVYPELVVYDDRGEPYSLRYHLLAPMLLNEVQRLRRELEALRRQAVTPR